MNEKFEPDINGMIADNDPIYKKLDEWHENDEYDRILDTIYAIPHKMWSNKLWFRVISALNNKKEFDKALNELNEISRRCETSVDMGCLYYMRGYIYYMNGNEIKALDYYTRAMQADPERNLAEDCEECRQYIDKRFENLEELSGKIIESLSERTGESTEKIELDDSEFTIMLGFLSGIRKVPNIDKCVGLDKLFFKFDDDEKEAVKDYLLRFYGIKDIDSLKETFRREFSIDAHYEDLKAYINGEPNFDLNELNSEGRAVFKSCIMFIERIIDKIPEGGLLAWDLSERIGLLRLAYGCDILSNSDYVTAISVYTDEAKKWYSSWEEYIKGVIFGGAFYMFWSGGSSIKDALEFMMNIVPLLIKSDMPDCIWHDDNVVIKLD